MGKTNKGDLGCWLVVVLSLGAAFLIIHFIKDINKEYLVEYTGYIHSTGDPDKCRFIAIAKDRNYTINRIKKEEAIRQKKRICKECFPIDVQTDFNKSVSDREANDLYWTDRLKWSPLKLKYDSIDYNGLSVYMEQSGVLHINRGCGWPLGEKKELTRVPFTSIRTFKSTCAECVDAGLCEFIYQAVYNGIYDKSLIRNDDF